MEQVANGPEGGVGVIVPERRERVDAGGPHTGGTAAICYGAGVVARPVDAVRMHEPVPLKRVLATLFGRPDEVMLELGAGGELLVAKVRALLSLLSMAPERVVPDQKLAA